MSNEIIKRDANYKAAGVVAGLTNDSDLDVVQLRVDPVTKRLLVDATVSGDGIIDGDAVDAGTLGFMVLGTDGSNYQVLATDATGHLQVDVLSGAGGGIQYTEGDTDTTITGTAMMMEVAANTLQPIQGTVASGLLVDLGSNNDVVISDGGNVITVDGTVAVTNAGITTIAGAVSGSEMQVDVLTMPTITVNAHAVTNAGTFAVQVDGNALTSLQLIDDVIYVDDTATHATGTSKGVGIMAAATPTDSAIDVNDIGMVAMSLDRKLYSQAYIVSGGVASGAIASGAVASGAIASGAIASGAAVSGAFADGALVTLGAKADAKSTATDTTAITAMQVLKQISYMEQTPASRAVTNAGTFAVQVDGAALTALQLIDNLAVAVDGNYLNINNNIAGTDVAAGAGAVNAQTQRVTHASDDPVTTSVQLIDNAISGAGFNITQLGGANVPIGAGLEATAVRVTLPTNGTGIVGLAAGTNGIGKLTANSGVDIGDVDITSVVPGVAATSLGKAEDGAHTSGDVGVFALGVRQDTPNATFAANNDYHLISTDMVGGLRTALYETDFAVLGTTHVKKYYTSAGAATDGIIWSPAAGKRWYVTDIFINVSAAATVTLEDDLAGGDSTVWKAELAANSGWSHHFGTPLFSGEDAADLIITTSAGNVYVTVVGYEI